jgi:hypothetical protein
MCSQRWGMRGMEDKDWSSSVYRLKGFTENAKGSHLRTNDAQLSRRGGASYAIHIDLALDALNKLHDARGVLVWSAGGSFAGPAASVPLLLSGKKRLVFNQPRPSG